MELGFEAKKLACPYGPGDGLTGLEGNEQLVAKTRELIGPSVELMLDCWMAFDLEFAVRLGERLRPYGLKWMEDCLIPEDFQGSTKLRKRFPRHTLATGDIIFTGTPDGTGAAQGLFLADGDVITTTIDGIGTMANACVRVADWR